MPWFIKTESFTAQAKDLKEEVRRAVIKKHCSWVNKLNESGTKVYSGYLIDQNGLPGGGGLLLIEAISFESAQSIIRTDPMIKSGFVHWKLQQWINISKKKFT